MGGCSTHHHIENNQDNKYQAKGKVIQNVSGDFRVNSFFATSYLVKIKDDALSYRAYSRGISSEWRKQTLTANDN